MNPSDASPLPMALPPAATAGDNALAHTSLVVPGMFSAQGEGNPRQPPALAGTPTLSGLLQALRRRWPLALALAMAAAACAGGAVFALMPAKYPAQVLLQIPARGDVRVFGEGNDEPEFLLYKKNVEAMIRSPMVLDAACSQRTGAGTEVKGLELVRHYGVDWAACALKTDFLIGPEILKVTLPSDRPDEGAELINAIARAVTSLSFQKDNERRKKRLKDYKDNLDKLEQELTKLRQQLRAREKFLNVPDEKVRQAQYAAAFQQQLKAAEAVTLNRTEQVKAREEVASAELRFNSLEQTPIGADKIEEAFRQDERARDVFLELKKVDKEIVDTKANGQEDFIAPQLRNLEAKQQSIIQALGALKNKLQPEYERFWRHKAANELRERVRALKDQLATLEKQEPVLRAELTKTADEAKALAPNSHVPFEIVNLQSKINSLDSVYSEVAKTIQKMDAEVVNPRLSILQLAAEPKSKDYSRQSKLAGVGGLGMFLAVLLGVAFLEFRSGKISAVNEVAHGLGLHVVGSLPSMPQGARTSSSACQRIAAWQNQLHESIDAIRTLLLHASRFDNLRVIMITSATGGEGKTSVATQLAASLARAWRKTLLIDGDLRKPAAHQAFEVAQEPGLSELLRGEIELADAVKPTSLGRLWLMPAGHLDSHALQALAQDNVRGLFDELKQQYDFIILDACPVLPVADALLLGQHVDGVIFSILRDVSRAPAVFAAQQRISSLAIRILGAVLIGARHEIGTLGYA